MLPPGSNIHERTQIIAAEQDIIDTVEESKYLASAIHQAKLDLIPGGHSSPLEQPSAVCKIVRDFLI